ncbi:hypothetical protein PRVXT_001127 [Proteinivorax tanatarense]|uniref:Uncharacterized protein n=1 Tax=Proteinivorax tanatarense TaxID=1260629 RepID=A0AAU7VQ17_9FIRM
MCVNSGTTSRRQRCLPVGGYEQLPLGMLWIGKEGQNLNWPRKRRYLLILLGQRAGLETRCDAGSLSQL